MKITVLVENTTSNHNLRVEHGLSLYIETKKHKILFDAGDSDLFIENARKLKIDLSLVDLFILSHGHHDHGGGLNAFLEINNLATIYVQKHAFNPHFSLRGGTFVDISVPKPTHLERIKYTDNIFIIDDELTLFSHIKERDFYPQSNQNLYMTDHHTYVHDDFSHEQNLIIKSKNQHCLFAGCAHHGMINIIHEASSIIGHQVDVAIGGLHLYSRSSGISETIDTIKDLGTSLLNTKTKLFTCHCTGDKAYEILKPIMKDQMTYIRTGETIEIYG